MEDKRLTLKQQRFIDEYLKTGNASDAFKKAGYTSKAVRQNAHALVTNRYIAEEIRKRREEMEKQSIIEGKEVMEFFASVMRGEVKDQFGLETSVADRIKAGQELAKRTIDIDNRISGVADAKVEICLDWGLDESKEQ